jgi:hypothetical protein
MQVGNGEAKSLGESWYLSSEQEGFVIGDAAYVLHGSSKMLRNENLIILSKRIFLSKKNFIEAETSLGDLEHLFVVN